MTDTRNGQGFVKGLFGGALLGTLASLLFAPEIRAAFTKLRDQMTAEAADAGDVATGAYRDAATRARNAVDEIEAKGRDIYGKALDAIAHGAEDVAERATQARANQDQTKAKTTGRSS